MKIREIFCPSCGFSLPQSINANELFKCPACNSTLYLSDWQIGETQDAVVVATPTRIYTVADRLMRDDLCNVYRCLFKIDDQDRQGIFRLTRDPGDNDLVQNEAQVLYHLQTADNYEVFRAFLPSVLESFLYQDASLPGARRVNICALHEQIAAPSELHSLEEVHEYYLNGIDPRDMAWMWRRLLFILGSIHDQQVVHGAVLPKHVLIEPKDHKLILSGWGFAVRDIGASGSKLTALSLTYEDWYPPEVQQKQPPKANLDLYMAARCMLYLIGADPLGPAKHRNLEPKLERYFAQCLEPDPLNRPQNTWKLLEEFDRIIEQLWGPRKFRVFNMPYKA